MPEAIEACKACGVEVPPSQAQSVRSALDHASAEQRAEMAALYGGEAPALLCTNCFIPLLTTINNTIRTRQQQANL